MSDDDRLSTIPDSPVQPAPRSGLVLKGARIHPHDDALLKIGGSPGR